MEDITLSDAAPGKRYTIRAIKDEPRLVNRLSSMGLVRGSAESSILYKAGVLIEPVTMFFGLKWEAFLAFCASAISKESLLGVLNTLYGTGGSLVSSTFGAKASSTAAAGISEILAANFTKAEGLAFIFAISFNMPCVSALAATARETHSVNWTAKIGVFYTVAALLISCIVYHVGLLVF